MLAAARILAFSPICDVPRWDPTWRELVFRGHIVKRFSRPASSQDQILAAFEKKRGPPSIRDPLPRQPGRCAKPCLNKTIEQLNCARLNPLISFHGDGTGRRICWRIVLADA